MILVVNFSGPLFPHQQNRVTTNSSSCCEFPEHSRFSINGSYFYYAGQRKHGPDKKNPRMRRNLEVAGTQTPQAELCRKTGPYRGLHSTAWPLPTRQNDWASFWVCLVSVHNSGNQCTLSFSSYLEIHTYIYNDIIHEYNFPLISDLSQLQGHYVWFQFKSSSALIKSQAGFRVTCGSLMLME